MCVCVCGNPDMITQDNARSTLNMRQYIKLLFFNKIQ